MRNRYAASSVLTSVRTPADSPLRHTIHIASSTSATVNNAPTAMVMLKPGSGGIDVICTSPQKFANPLGIRKNGKSVSFGSSVRAPCVFCPTMNAITSYV